MSNKQDANKLESEKKKKVEDNALKLIDLDGKNLDSVTLKKVVSTWYKMLTERYPKLKDIFDNIEIKGKKALEWHKEWQEYEQKKIMKKKPAKELTGNWDQSTVGSTTKLTKVRTEVGHNNNQPLSAKQVRIVQVEMPEKLRAKTQFGNRQGSHTIAWTFLKTSLMEMFTKKNKNTVDDFLKGLAKLVENDKQSLDDSATELEAEAETLHKRIRDAQQQQRPLHGWIREVNELFAEYVELNQKLPTTTYSLEIPKGRGEAAINKVLKKFKKQREKTISDIDSFFKQKRDKTISTEDNDYKEIVEKYAKYIDSGFFYRIYIQQINLCPAPPRESNMRPETPIKIPDEIKPDNVENILKYLYDVEEKALKKVFGDFYLYLEYFHPSFYQQFKGKSEWKKEFVENVLIAPLNEGVGNLIRNRLALYEKYIDINDLITEFINRIKENSSAWAKDLLPTPPTDSSS